jgi:hypothetical protein
LVPKSASQGASRAQEARGRHHEGEDRVCHLLRRRHGLRRLHPRRKPGHGGKLPPGYARRSRNLPAAQSRNLDHDGVAATRPRRSDEIRVKENRRINRKILATN